MNELYAFICITITELVLKVSNRTCLGCINSKKLALNHSCQQMSLLDKYQNYYNEVMSKFSENLKSHVNHFIRTYPQHASNSDELLSIAKNFIRFSTPKTLYFGGYVEDEANLKRSIEAIVEGGIVNDTIKHTTTPVDKPKPAVKRPRKNATTAKPTTPPSIEKTLSDTYDSVPYYDVN